METNQVFTQQSLSHTMRRISNYSLSSINTTSTLNQHHRSKQYMNTYAPICAVSANSSFYSQLKFKDTVGYYGGKAWNNSKYYLSAAYHSSRLYSGKLYQLTKEHSKGVYENGKNLVLNIGSLIVSEIVAASKDLNKKQKHTSPGSNAPDSSSSQGNKNVKYLMYLGLKEAVKIYKGKNRDDILPVIEQLPVMLEHIAPYVPYIVLATRIGYKIYTYKTESKQRNTNQQNKQPNASKKMLPIVEGESREWQTIALRQHLKRLKRLKEQDGIELNKKRISNEKQYQCQSIHPYAQITQVKEQHHHKTL